MANEPSFEDRTYAKVDWRLIPFLFLCYILAYLDRVNVGFAKLQMLSDLGLSEAAFATGAGIFFVGYFLLEVPSNLCLKRFGARTWIARIMISWGLVSSAMMFVRLPTIVKAFGVKGYLATGLITALPYAVAVVGMILLSRHSDRTGERRMHYVLNVTAGGIGLVLSGIFAAKLVLAMIFLSIGTLGVIGSMPLFWPVPSTFLAGTAAAAGIGVVNSVGNLGGYIGPNVPIWIKSISTDPSAPLYAIAAALFAGALLAWVFIPKNSPIVSPRPDMRERDNATLPATP